MTPGERAIFEKRRRGRNIALLLLLVGLSVLFCFIGIARLLRSCAAARCFPDDPYGTGKA
jgi:hypothetical protein